MRHLIRLVGLYVRQRMHFAGHSVHLPYIVDKGVSVAVDGNDIDVYGVVSSRVHAKEGQSKSWEHSPARNQSF